MKLLVVLGRTDRTGVTTALTPDGAATTHLLDDTILVDAALLAAVLGAKLLLTTNANTHANSPP